MAVTYLKTSDVQKKIDRIKQMGGNARFKLVGGSQLDGQYWDLYIDRINPKTNRPQKNFKILSYVGLNEVSSELDKLIATTRDPSLQSHRWYKTTNRLLLKNRKKKTRKKVIRRKRRSKAERRVMKIKRGLLKRAKKLRLGVKRTGAYVYGTLRKIVGNPMEYDVLSDKYIVTGSPYRDRMKALLTHIYAMRDAGKSQAAMKPFIKEYKNLKRIVTPLRSNPPFGKIMRAFEKAGFHYHAAGTIRDKSGKKKLYDYYKGDSLTEDQKSIIRKEIPTAEFMRGSSEYAPEMRRAVVAFPSGSIRVQGMYAHHLGNVVKNPMMRSHRTHGLSLKQMMKLYRMVSRGNPRAIKFAKSILGIPASESLSQVKAVVYHHILDLKGKV
jgi:hypothetical protein